MKLTPDVPHQASITAADSSETGFLSNAARTKLAAVTITEIVMHEASHILENSFFFGGLAVLSIFILISLPVDVVDGDAL